MKVNSDEKNSIRVSYILMKLRGACDRTEDNKKTMMWLS